MSKMIERVAKAIHEAMDCSEFNNCEMCMTAAIVAIEAMKEPPVDRGEIYNKVYVDMIETALKD